MSPICSIKAVSDSMKDLVIPVSLFAISAVLEPPKGVPKKIIPAVDSMISCSERGGADRKACDIGKPVLMALTDDIVRRGYFLNNIAPHGVCNENNRAPPTFLFPEFQHNGTPSSVIIDSLVCGLQDASTADPQSRTISGL